MNQRLPILATILGVAGLLPFLACGLAALGPQGDRGAMALAAYGAVILAFLGGVHWGFALQDPDGPGQRARLAWGVVPSLVGWVSLLLVVAVQVDAGLVMLLLGALATTVVEARARRAGLVPAGYMTLRYGLTGGVVVVLSLVLALRVLGARIAY